MTVKEVKVESLIIDVKELWHWAFKSDQQLLNINALAPSQKFLTSQRVPLLPHLCGIIWEKPNFLTTTDIV